MPQFDVPRYDYAAQFEGIAVNILKKIENALRGGRYILSEEVIEFEQCFAKYFSHREVVSVNSGTDALLLSLLALNIGPGDEVIVPANTFYATAVAVALCGATPKLIDVDPLTFLADDNFILDAISPRTRAVIVVHLYGKCAPVKQLAAVLRTRGIALIEDAAQAHGSLSNDGYGPGAFSDAACYSFHPSKNLSGAGDGGAVGTNCPVIADALRVLRSLGQVKQNEHVRIAYNSKLDTLQAIILSAKLPYLAAGNQRRAEIAAHYRNEMRDLPLIFQKVDVAERHIFHLFQVRTKRRDALIRSLQDAGVDAVIRYPTPIHLQQAFSYLGYRPNDYPVAEALCQELVALPLFPSMSQMQVECVVNAVKSFFKGHL